MSESKAMIIVMGVVTNGFCFFFAIGLLDLLLGGRVAFIASMLIVVGACALFQSIFRIPPYYLLFGLRSVEYQDAAGKKQNRLILKHPAMRPVGTTVFILTCIYILYCVFYSCRF